MPGSLTRCPGALNAQGSFPGGFLSSASIPKPGATLPRVSSDTDRSLHPCPCSRTCPSLSPPGHPEGLAGAGGRAAAPSLLLPSGRDPASCAQVPASSQGGQGRGHAPGCLYRTPGRCHGTRDLLSALPQLPGKAPGKGGGGRGRGEVIFGSRMIWLFPELQEGSRRSRSQCLLEFRSCCVCWPWVWWIQPQGGTDSSSPPGTAGAGSDPCPAWPR